MTEIISSAIAKRWDQIMKDSHKVLEDAFREIVRDPNLGTFAAAAISIKHTSSGFMVMTSDLPDRASAVFEVLTRVARVPHGWGFSSTLDFNLPKPGSRILSMSFVHPSFLTRAGHAQEVQQP